MSAAAAVETRVLIVEDDPASSEIIQIALRRHGISSLCAGTVGEALILMEQERMPTAILVDINLPDANGSLLVRRIRREGLPVKVAIVTGVAQPERYEVLLDSPPDKLFPKPVNIGELIRWVQGEEDKS